MHYTERSFIFFLELVGKEAQPRKLVIQWNLSILSKLHSIVAKCIVAVWDLQDVAVLRR